MRVKRKERIEPLTQRERQMFEEYEKYRPYVQMLDGRSSKELHHQSSKTETQIGGLLNANTITNKDRHNKEPG